MDKIYWTRILHTAVFVHNHKAYHYVRASSPNYKKIGGVDSLLESSSKVSQYALLRKARSYSFKTLMQAPHFSLEPSHEREIILFPSFI